MVTAPSPELELFLLGTGTSSAVPSIGCLTSKEKGCFCCRSTLDLAKYPDAIKNNRRNTGAVLRIPSEEIGGRTKSLVIDCGKTFYSAALEHWPKQGWREIDAVLITHPHADAILGLDDLRGWTLHQNVQKSIDIFCNQYTYDEIAKTFPYLADTSKATGGGDVPQFSWCIFDDTQPVEICGVRVVPLPVHHGKIFSSPPQPNYCLGFLFNSTLAYLSDVSFIPPEVWNVLNRECTLPPHPDNLLEDGVLGHAMEKPKIQALVVDCLRIEQHASHFGLPQAVETARRIGAPKTYLVGFGHRMSHDSWVHTCKALEAGERSTLPSDPAVREPKPEHSWQVFGGHPDIGVEDWDVTKDHALRAVESWEGGVKDPLWIRPGCDGLRIFWGTEQGARDDVYV